MNTGLLAAAAIAALIPSFQQQQAASQPETGTRFEAVDVFVDAGKAPLAAYQVRFKAVTAQADHDAILVGVEGGEGVFEDPPYYDAKALETNRIVVAAYSLANALPMGRTRVARLHLQLAAGQPVRYECVLDVAGDAEANAIPAKAEALLVVRPTVVVPEASQTGKEQAETQTTTQKDTPEK